MRLTEQQAKDLATAVRPAVPKVNVFISHLVNGSHAIRIECGPGDQCVWFPPANPVDADTCVGLFIRVLIETQGTQAVLDCIAKHGDPADILAAAILAHADDEDDYNPFDEDDAPASPLQGENHVR